MMKTAMVAVLTSLVMIGALEAQQVSPKWEELTAADFVKALQQARGTCALPFGILEKHGPAGVLGTDLINVRFSTLKATKDAVRRVKEMTYDNADEVRALAAKHGFAVKAVAMKNTHHAGMTELLIGRDLRWLEEPSALREEATPYRLATTCKPRKSRRTVVR
jgi:hypothetical protein